MMYSIKNVTTLCYETFARALYYDLCTKLWPSMHSISPACIVIYDVFGKS